MPLSQGSLRSYVASGTVQGYSRRSGKMAPHMFRVKLFILQTDLYDSCCWHRSRHKGLRAKKTYPQVQLRCHDKKKLKNIAV